MPDDAPPSRAPDAPAQPIATSPSAVRRKRRRLNRSRRIRLITRISVGFVILLIILAIALTQGPIPKLIARSAIRNALGAEFDASWVSMRIDGTLVIDDPKLRVPDPNHTLADAAEFFTAKSIRIEMAFSGFLWTTLTPRAVTVDDATLRLSQSTTDSSLNISSLVVPPSAQASSAALPTIEINAAQIEYGEHAPASAPSPGYHRLASVPMRGALTPASLAPAMHGQYQIRAAQTGGEPLGRRGAPLTLSGLFDTNTGAGELTSNSLSLSRWTPAKMPVAIRDIWQQVNIAGEVARTRVAFSRERGVAVTLTVADVRATLPISLEEADGGPISRPRLRNVDGDITLSPAGLTADLDATLEELRVHIDFASESLDFDAPSRCTITARDFELQRKPRLLLLAPKVFRTIATLFSEPTGIVDARINLLRRANSAVSVTGELALRKGNATFIKFPYQVVDVHGLIRFDMTKLELIDLRGVGPTGAAVVANGVVSPLDSTSGLDLTVVLTDVPIDDKLRAAVNLSRGRGMLDLMFNEAEARRLVDAGLIADPLRHAAAQAQLNHVLNRLTTDEAQADDDTMRRITELRRVIQTPPFELGGVFDRILVNVHNDVGIGSPYLVHLELDLKRAGLVPAVFAYPILARDMKIVIDDDRVRVSAAEFRGLSGGIAEFSAQLPISNPDAPAPTTPAQPSGPTLRLLATGIPIDDLLLHALPRADEWSTLANGDFFGPPAPPDLQFSNPAASPFDPRTLLRDLNVSGVVDCEASLNPPATLGQASAFDVRVSLKNLAAAPTAYAEAPPVRVQSLTGTLAITPSGIRIQHLRGQLRHPPDPSDPLGLLDDLLQPGNNFDADATITFGDSLTAPVFTANIGVSDFDVTLGIESLIAPVSPIAADQVARARTSAHPSGRVTAALALAGDLGGAATLSLALNTSAANGIVLQLLDGRLELDQLSGTLGTSLKLDALSTPAFTLRADNAVLNLWFKDRPAGVLELDGLIKGPLDTHSSTASAAASLLADATVQRPVTTKLRGIRLDSPLALTLASNLGPAWLHPAITDNQVHGLFDADIQLSSLGSAPKYSGSIRPNELSMVVNNELIDFPIISGDLTFSPQGGMVNQITLLADRWDIRANGPWLITPEAVSTDLQLTADAGRFDPDFLAVLPSDVQAAIANSRISVAGGITARDARLAVVVPRGPGRVRTNFKGDLRVSDISADVGFDIRRATGTLTVAIDQPETDDPATVTLTLRESSLVAGRLSLSEGSGLCVINPVGEPGWIRLRSLAGQTSGGTVELRANVLPRPAPNLARPYNANIELAGVRFADLMRDIRRNAALDGQIDLMLPPELADLPFGSDPTFAVGLPARMDTNVAELPGYSGDHARGSLSASLTVQGDIGDVSTRKGTGIARIVGGDVIRVPLVVPIIKLTSLQLPIDERLDYLQAGFTVEGNRVLFHEIGLLGANVAILGHGDVLLPGFDLDLRFATNAPGGIPILGDLLDGLRNQIITTTVKGTLNDPKIGTSVFAAPRRFFRQIGGSETEIADGLDDETRARLRSEREKAILPLLGPPVVKAPTKP